MQRRAKSLAARKRAFPRPKLWYRGGAFCRQGGGAVLKRTLAERFDAAVLDPPDSPLRWHRAVASMLALLVAAFAVQALVIVATGPVRTDFLSFWAAAKLALQGVPALAYDLEAHRDVQQGAVAFEGMLPFPYPPPFLLMLLPFAIGSYALGFIAFVLVTCGLYLLASRRIAPLPYRAAHPQVLVGATTGQTTFLTAAIFIAGTSLLSRRPLLGGMVLGLMILKPQLAFLLPVALLAAGAWRAIVGGLLSASAALLLALLAFGPDTYRGFFEILPLFADAMRESRWPWHELASPFAVARHCGVSQAAALAIHAIIALGAATLVWRAWHSELEQRVPVLAAATLLVPPYLFAYDALLLVVPIAWFAQRREFPGVVSVAWLLCLLPVLGYFEVYAGPNTIPLAALLCLWALHRSEAPAPARDAVEAA